jgi:hypothetical protein
VEAKQFFPRQKYQEQVGSPFSQIRPAIKLRYTKVKTSLNLKKTKNNLEEATPLLRWLLQHIIALYPGIRETLKLW